MDISGLIDDLHAPLSVLMLLIFCALVAWAYAPQRRSTMEDQAQIPLRDDR